MLLLFVCYNHKYPVPAKREIWMRLVKLCLPKPFHRVTCVTSYTFTSKKLTMLGELQIAA
jgi:hypothetical protein